MWMVFDKKKEKSHDATLLIHILMFSTIIKWYVWTAYNSVHRCTCMAKIKCICMCSVIFVAIGKVLESHRIILLTRRAKAQKTPIQSTEE